MRKQKKICGDFFSDKRPLLLSYCLIRPFMNMKTYPRNADDADRAQNNADKINNF